MPKDDDLDQAYQEYLWGEPSPRTFARKARVAGSNERILRDLASLMSR